MNKYNFISAEKAKSLTITSLKDFVNDNISDELETINDGIEALAEEGSFTYTYVVGDDRLVDAITTFLQDLGYKVSKPYEDDDGDTVMDTEKEV